MTPTLSGARRGKPPFWHWFLTYQVVPRLSPNRQLLISCCSVVNSFRTLRRAPQFMFWTSAISIFEFKVRFGRRAYISERPGTRRWIAIMHHSTDSSNKHDFDTQMADQISRQPNRNKVIKACNHAQLWSLRWHININLDVVLELKDDTLLYKSTIIRVAVIHAIFQKLISEIIHLATIAIPLCAKIQSCGINQNPIRPRAGRHNVHFKYEFLFDLFVVK